MTNEAQIKLQKLQSIYSALIVLERALDDGTFPTGVLTLKSGSRFQSFLVAVRINDLLKGSKQ